MGKITKKYKHFHLSMVPQQSVTPHNQELYLKKTAV